MRYVLGKNVDLSEMLIGETGEKKKICYKQRSHGLELLFYYGGSEKTSTWSSPLFIFNSFFSWGHLLHRLNCANPQSKLCILHSCESGWNAEGQFNTVLFLLTPFCTRKKHIRFCPCALWEGVMGRATHQSFSRSGGRTTDAAQSLVQLPCDLLYTRASELLASSRQM